MHPGASAGMTEAMQGAITAPRDLNAVYSAHQASLKQAHGRAKRPAATGKVLAFVPHSRDFPAPDRLLRAMRSWRGCSDPLRRCGEWAGQYRRLERHPS